jgi:hypothetical protein
VWPELMARTLNNGNSGKKMSEEYRHPNPVINLLRKIEPFATWRYLQRTLAISRYNQDGLTTVHNCEFLYTAEFGAAYEAGRATGAWPDSDPRYRAFEACWAAQYALRLDGDFVECGVDRGGLAMTILHYTDFVKSAKQFYLLDTYEGFPKEQHGQVASVQDVHKYNDSYADVKRSFAKYSDQVQIVKGVVPASLAEVHAQRIAYLSLDLNSALPEIEALTLLWDRLVPGAVVISDDYCFTGYEKHTKAYDQFARSKDLRMLPLPTGQGLLFKP